MKIKLLPSTVLILAGCATGPRGPDVAVMPGPGKSFEQFQVDDRACRDYAEKSLGPNAGGGASVAQGAAVGTVLG
ncbi:MAG: glycine zipper family protein, partial [Elusimicrobiota bacterium]